MARPVGKLHQDDIRRKIQASQLINRLTNHVLGEVEMSATQVQAARILLGKSVPDLSSVALTGEEGGPVELEFRWASEKS